MHSNKTIQKANFGFAFLVKLIIAFDCDIHLEKIFQLKSENYQFQSLVSKMPFLLNQENEKKNLQVFVLFNQSSQVLNLLTSLLLLVLPVTIPVLVAGQTGAERPAADVPLPIIPERRRHHMKYLRWQRCSFQPTNPITISVHATGFNASSVTNYKAIILSDIRFGRCFLEEQAHQRKCSSQMLRDLIWIEVMTCGCET